MKYLCLIYSDESQWAAMSEAQVKAVLGEYFAFTDEIKASGNLLGGNSLLPTASATTVRVRNGKMSATDGPFAETKGATDRGSDLNDAIRVAVRIPSARMAQSKCAPSRSLMLRSAIEELYLSESGRVLATLVRPSETSIWPRKRSRMRSRRRWRGGRKPGRQTIPGLADLGRPL